MMNAGFQHGFRGPFPFITVVLIAAVLLACTVSAPAAGRQVTGAPGRTNVPPTAGLVFAV